MTALPIREQLGAPAAAVEAVDLEELAADLVLQVPDRLGVARLEPRLRDGSSPNVIWVRIPSGISTR